RTSPPFPYTTLFRSRVRAIVPGVEIVGRERHRALEARERVVAPPERIRRDAAIVVRRRDSGVHRDGGVDLTDGRGMLAALRADDSEQMKAVEMPRLRRQNAPVELLRLVETAALMQGQRGTPDRAAILRP